MDVLPLLIVDYGNVLYDIDFDLTLTALRALPGYNGKPIKFGVDDQDEIFFKVDRGELSPAEFRNALRAHYGFTCSDDELNSAWCAILKAPYTHATDTLTELRTSYPGSRMVMLSNISEPHIAHAEPRSPFLDQFDAIYYSCRIGLRKPDPRAFEYVLQEERTKAADAILFDDSVVNCEAARGLGMRVVRVTPGDPYLASRVPEAD